MPYNRGYTLENRGPYSHWTCLREDCRGKGSARGDQHDDIAEWAAAAHQQKEHRDQLIHDAADALMSAYQALGPLLQTLTDIDADTLRGRTCVTPDGAKQALLMWRWQLEALLPQPDGAVEQGTRQSHLEIARQRMCQHDNRHNTSASWPVLMGMVDLDAQRTWKETP